ncbi:MAG TPA: regulatory iron-sulfur-containing complex subunit RicT [Bacteroidales bacterium]|nr:regulatory iron-sulfur-containing complex subunit RicT [Bacteroidales bacterium]
MDLNTIKSLQARGLMAIEIDGKINLHFTTRWQKLTSYKDIKHDKDFYIAFPEATEIVEVQFKNDRKQFYKNTTGIPLEIGEIVAVEATPGHDIGVVSLTGKEAIKQLERKKPKTSDGELLSLYRIAKDADIDKFLEAIKNEEIAIKKTKEIIKNYKLNMKLTDVEYQGDGTKATFYYIADDRVDFRELIKTLAGAFRIRVEMRQIGARQESAKLGWVGPCGRELCCSTYKCSFSSVSITAVNIQQLTLNPQRLAGLCTKLKCCLSYELPLYEEFINSLPPTDIPLLTKQAKAHFVKADMFQNLMFYSFDNQDILFGLPVNAVVKIQELNKKGEIPDSLDQFAITSEFTVMESVNQEDLSKLEDE